MSVIHCTGHIVKSNTDVKKENNKGSMQSCFVAVGQPIPHPLKYRSSIATTDIFDKAQFGYEVYTC
ncbi:hypothetical protein NQ314_000779 [Rhamnusium bicolor]|uniref:Uncharacterized protein n=1 Tax=Rhamnusium bicolor TaxID=1586634 RepID=A0AAV8ZTM0_9CUCU|nr:hypothetical protein NQ314_000779 [Rhamnusium bicolor]